MYPPAIGPASHILAGSDDRTAPRADLARRVRLVVIPQGAVLVLAAHGPVIRWRHAQVFLQPLFNIATPEIWWDCHVCLPRGDGVIQLLTASLAPVGPGCLPRPSAPHLAVFSFGPNGPWFLPPVTCVPQPVERLI